MTGGAGGRALDYGGAAITRRGRPCAGGICPQESSENEHKNWGTRVPVGFGLAEAARWR